MFVIAAIWLAANGLVCGHAGHAAEKRTFTVKDLGYQFGNNRQNITGLDAASAISLPNGDAFWIFGDTIEGPFQDIRRHDLTEVRSNTGAIVPPQDPSSGISQFEFLTDADGRVRQLIVFSDDEPPAKRRLWAVHGICAGTKIYLYYHHIGLDPTVSVFDGFQLRGMGIARAEIGAWQFERLSAPDGTREFWKGNEPGFGVFVLRDKDGLVYLWGCLQTQMFLARTRISQLDDLRSYEYLIAAPTQESPQVVPRWGARFQNTAPLFDGVPNEMSVSWNEYLRCFIAIHTWHRENKLVLRTAPALAGPWSPPETFYTPAKVQPDDVFYAAKEHPELAADSGRILYVTFVDSRNYRPRLLQVSLDGPP